MRSIKFEGGLYMDGITFKTAEKVIIVAFILTVLFSLCGFTAKCESISEKIIRLHILANSDSTADQELKLKVRDKVNVFCAQILEQANTKEQAVEIITKNIKEIENVAQNEVHTNGYDYNVSAQFLNMKFNTREYENFTLPAGDYDALRINIGRASGKNWWCVVFPELCISCAENRGTLEDVLNPSEVEIVCNNEDYKFKFKSIELYENLKERFKLR